VFFVFLLKIKVLLFQTKIIISSVLFVRVIKWTLPFNVCDFLYLELNHRNDNYRILRLRETTIKVILK